MNSTPPQIPVQPLPLEHELTNFVSRLKGTGSIKMVALGSSSTAGEGDIPPYPHRLEMLLRPPLSNRRIDILNRGLGGEEAPTEFDRIADDVLAEDPCLVIWQIGTNCVWQSASDNPPSQQQTIDALRRGIELLQKLGTIDIVLMDPQYLPAMLTPAVVDASNAMVDAIAGVAKETSVNLFRRFDLMKRWSEIAKISFEQMVDPNDDKRLHQSEWATDMLAKALRDVVLVALNRSGISTS